jgi:hypothetical protein
VVAAPWFYEAWRAGAPDRPAIALSCSSSRCRCSRSLAPLASFYPRRHEFEADAFAARRVGRPARARW